MFDALNVQETNLNDTKNLKHVQLMRVKLPKSKESKPVYNPTEREAQLPSFDCIDISIECDPRDLSVN